LRLLLAAHQYQADFLRFRRSPASSTSSTSGQSDPGPLPLTLVRAILSRLGASVPLLLSAKIVFLGIDVKALLSRIDEIAVLATGTPGARGFTVHGVREAMRGGGVTQMILISVRWEGGLGL